MTWTTQFTEDAWNDLERLPPKIANAIVEFAFHTLPTNPERMSKPLQGDFSRFRSARRGEYRVVFVLDEESGVLRVYRARHRSVAYRPPAPRRS